MRLRHRHDDDARTDDSGDGASPDVPQRGTDQDGPRQRGRLGFAASRQTDDRDRADDPRADDPRADDPRADDPRTDDRDDVRGERRRDRDAAAAPRPGHDVTPEREVVVETVKERRDLSSMLAVASGAALIVVGTLALVRTGVDSSWYDPVVQVAGMDHTALLGAIEVAFGALLVLAGLAGARMLAALVALVGGVAATLVAIEPDLVDRELALERGWAVILAVAGILLALILVMARGRHVERRIEHRPMTA